MSKSNGAKPTDNENGAHHNGRGFTRSTDISHEMQGAYLDYAMSVIVARALPDVRDGLKPVHRRIMYALWHDLGLTADKAHKKSARIVGEVLGKYHPHGDSSVYDAMVRLAQPFAMRYPLIDGQGNFGSVDGDNAAAMRYTEARLASISNLMMEDLEKDTVEWRANFDNTLREPQIVPAALPNLLINGSSGIAVGMATNIPPHNLGEVVDAAVHVIDHFDHLEDVSIEDLLAHIKGPDFPTGGILYRYRDDTKTGDGEQIDAIAQGYSTGKARLIMQAKAHYEEMARGRMRIIITELPYQTNKSALIERIADLVREGKIEGIGDLRDESDRTGMRVCIELKRDVDAKAVLTSLYKYTPLQQTFGMQLLALVDGQPKLLNLKRVLQYFVQHRQEIIRRRSEYDLAKARERIHIVEGLLHALDILDEVIATIRKSQTVDTARKNLIANFKFSEVQAQAILDMQLRRLAALERKKLQEEHEELEKRIKFLLDLLANPQKVLALIKEDLLAIKDKYADARRTQIVDRTKGAHTTHDLIADQEVLVTVGGDGEVRRTGVGRLTASSLRQTAKNSDVALLSANTRDVLYVFNADGRCARIGIHELPVEGSKHVSDLGAFMRRTKLVAALALPRGNGVPVDGYLFLVTEGAVVKRVSIADVIATPSNEFGVINVDDKDRLGWAFRTRGDQDVMLVSNAGQAIRFSEEEVRSMGFAAAGVGGMRLGKGNKVIYASVVDPEGALITVTTTGYGKVSPLSEYPVQGRNGGGIVAHKTTTRTGDVVAAELLMAQRMPKMVALLAGKTTPRSIDLDEIPRTARATQGKQIIDGVTVTAIRYIAIADEGEPVAQPVPAAAPRLVEARAPAVKVASGAESSAAPVKLEPRRAEARTSAPKVAEAKSPAVETAVPTPVVARVAVPKTSASKIEAPTKGVKAVDSKVAESKVNKVGVETPPKATKTTDSKPAAARKTEVKTEVKPEVETKNSPVARAKAAPAVKSTPVVKSAPEAKVTSSPKKVEDNPQAGLFGDMDAKPFSKKASKLNTVTSVKNIPPRDSSTRGTPSKKK